MKKAQSLRDHMTAAIPYLKANPDRLKVFVEKGAAACSLRSLSFEYRYELTLGLEDYTEHADTILLPLLAWVAINEPHLMQNPNTQEEVIRFEAEILDNDAADILITLPVRERVKVVKTDTGYQAEHMDEPPLADLTGPTVWALYGNDALLAVDPAP